MTIIRFISRSSIIFRSSFINFQSSSLNQFQRNASILSVNLWHNENFYVKNYTKPKISHSLEGQFVRNKFKKPKKYDDDQADVSKIYYLLFNKVMIKTFFSLILRWKWRKNLEMINIQKL